MKGIVFREFIELVETKFSPELADEIIQASNLPSGGSYTGVGTYDHGEILQLVTQLSQKTKISIPDLVRTFGEYLFSVFVKKFPSFFVEPKSAYEFLKRIDDYIHVEVRKLYADAELPTFKYEEISDKKLILEYISNRPFADLAHGLIYATIVHFGGGYSIKRENLSELNNHVKFIIEAEAA